MTTSEVISATKPTMQTEAGRLSLPYHGNPEWLTMQDLIGYRARDARRQATN